MPHWSLLNRKKKPFTLFWVQSTELWELFTCSSEPSVVTMVTEWAPWVASSWAGIVMVVPSWVTMVIVPPIAWRSASEILTWKRKEHWVWTTLWQLQIASFSQVKVPLRLEIVFSIVDKQSGDFAAATWYLMSLEKAYARKVQS